MSSHNRRDPKLPDLKPVDKMDRGLTLQQIMERAKPKLVTAPSKWQRYGERATSGTEAGEPESER